MSKEFLLRLVGNPQKPGYFFSSAFLGSKMGQDWYYDKFLHYLNNPSYHYVVSS